MAKLYRAQSIDRVFADAIRLKFKGQSRMSHDAQRSKIRGREVRPVCNGRASSCLLDVGYTIIVALYMHEDASDGFSITATVAVRDRFGWMMYNAMVRKRTSQIVNTVRGASTTTVIALQMFPSPA